MFVHILYFSVKAFSKLVLVEGLQLDLPYMHSHLLEDIKVSLLGRSVQISLTSLPKTKLQLTSASILPENKRLSCFIH